MKNAKKLLAFILASLMVLSCLAGMLPVLAAEDEASEIPTPTPTYELDFTKYCDSMNESFYIGNSVGNFSLIDSGANGHLTVHMNSGVGALSFQVGKGTFQKGSDLVVDAPANQMGYFVIKYKTKQTCLASLYTSTADTAKTDEITGGFAAGSVGFGNAPKWYWNGLDEWTVQVVDASENWGSVPDSEYIQSFIFRLAEDHQPMKAAAVHLAYVKFFATKEDAEAFADSEASKTVKIETGGTDLSAGYTLGGRKLYSSGEVYEMTPVALDVVGGWTSYPDTTTEILADGMFLGTGESIDATTEGVNNDVFKNAISGETHLGGGGYPDTVSGVIKVTSEHTYLRFWGWSGQETPVDMYGYQIGDNEPVWDPDFTWVDKELASMVGGWGHPNALRFCITLPLTGLEEGKTYPVQILVRHEDGTIGTMNAGFKSFKLAYGVAYDYQDAAGNLYAFDGAKMIGEDGRVLYAAKFDDGKIRATNGYFYALEGDEQILRFADAPEVPEATPGWKVKPLVYEAADFADGAIDVTIPTGERQYTWITIKGMAGKVLSVDNEIAAMFLSITDSDDNTYDFRNSPSYYGLALPILTDEYTVRIRTVDTSGEDQVYRFFLDDMLLTPDALEGRGTTADPYILKYSNKYTVMAKGQATFRYVAPDDGEISIFSTMGTLDISTTADEELIDGILPVSEGDVVTAVLSSADGVSYVYAGINFTGVEIDHKHDLETVPGVPATCQKEGTTDKKVCSVCGMTVQRATVTPIVDHKYEKVEKKDATCTEAGCEEHVKCFGCNDIRGELTVIPAKGHTAGDWEIATEATVGAAGKRVKKCTACAAILEEEAIAALDAPATDAPATEAPAATTEAKGGCGSVIGMSAAAVVLAAAAAAVALKKRD